MEGHQSFSWPNAERANQSSLFEFMKLKLMEGNCYYDPYPNDLGFRTRFVVVVIGGDGSGGDGVVDLSFISFIQAICCMSFLFITA